MDDFHSGLAVVFAEDVEGTRETPSSKLCINF